MKKLISSILLSYSLLSFAHTPFERLTPRNNSYDYIQSRASSQGDFFVSSYGDSDDNLFFYSFNFTNHGPNIIVPTEPDQLEHPRRDYNFISEDHSKSETYLWMTDDNGSGRISDLFESIFVFLPRTTEVEIQQINDEIIVTLPTDEKVIFDRDSKVIKSGVLIEEEIDLNSRRNFAKYEYTGKGIYIRVNAKGNDPRIGGYASIYKNGLPECKISKGEFWTQDSWPTFMYHDDNDVYTIIKKYCGVDYLP